MDQLTTKDWPADSYRLELILPGLPARVNEWAGRSWHSKHKESIKWLKRLQGTLILTRQQPPPGPLQRASLTLIRYSSRCPDYDGLVSGFKPVIDSLKKMAIIVDDNMNVIGAPTYKWQPARAKHGMIKIIVEEVRHEFGD
jgi:hypothetical protein